MTLLKEYLTKALTFPAEIHLESSSRCNSVCLMCPREGMTRYQGEMSRELFVKAVDECKDYFLTFIHFHVGGESLLMDIDELCWRIKYARVIKPEPFIEGHTTGLCFFTNGSLLTSERIEKILDSGLDKLVVSVDGGTKEDYERVRRGLNFETVVENVRNLVNMRNAIKSKMFISTAIVPQKANEKSVDAYHRLFMNMGVDDVGGSGVQNIGGLIDAKNMILPAQYMKGDINRPCWRVFLDLSILADGKAVVCCQDVRGNEIIGDLNKQTLKEIWQGERMTTIRNLFAVGLKKDIPFCAECDAMQSMVLDFPEWQQDVNFVNTFIEVSKELGVY